MGLGAPDVPGQTPLDENETHGLLLPTVATRGELDEWEQNNIEQAIQWTLGLGITPAELFSETFVRQLHERMFYQVWNWAGTFRTRLKNIGIDPWQIPAQLRLLLDDALYWHTHHTFPPNEIALRFKHRIVQIHCFPNGNGRHSRLMADLIADKIYGRPWFSWGAAHLPKSGDARSIYLQAVKAADHGDYGPLMAFARS